MNRKKTKVLLPKWWTETEKEVEGFTDEIVTYACSSEPALFVQVPEFSYEGYFNLKDLRTLKGNEFLCQ